MSFEFEEDGGVYIRDLKSLLKEMLAYSYSLEEKEKERFLKEVDDTISDLHDYAEGLVPEEKESSNE